MSRPRIFISHSAKPELEPAAHAKLKEIYERLAEEGFDVLLDLLRLEAGDDWRNSLNTWLALANGAVVLVSEQARDASRWVAREADILTWRQSRDPGFVLIPVTVQPVDKGSINGGLLADCGLDWKQAVAAEDPRLIAKLVRKLEHLRDELEAETPIREIERRIAEILSSVNVRYLRQVVAKLDPALDAWSPTDDVPRLVARLLLRGTLDDACEIIRELRSLSDESWDTLIEFIAPNWIDFRAAEPIRDIARQKRSVAINGRNIDTLRMYVWRASGRPTRGGWPCIEINNVPRENPGQAVVHQILKHLCEKKGLSEPNLRMVLSDEKDNETYLALSAQDMPQSVIEEVRRELGAVTFFMLTSEIPACLDLQEPLKNVCGVSGACFLAPEIDASAELEALKGYWRAQVLL